MNSPFKKGFTWTLIGGVSLHAISLVHDAKCEPISDENQVCLQVTWHPPNPHTTDEPSPVDLRKAAAAFTQVATPNASFYWGSDE